VSVPLASLSAALKTACTRGCLARVAWGRPDPVSGSWMGWQSISEGDGQLVREVPPAPRDAYAQADATRLIRCCDLANACCRPLKFQWQTLPSLHSETVDVSVLFSAHVECCGTRVPTRSHRALWVWLRCGRIESWLRSGSSAAENSSHVTLPSWSRSSLLNTDSRVCPYHHRSSPDRGGGRLHATVGQVSGKHKPRPQRCRP
jgi:hypothetical protein